MVKKFRVIAKVGNNPDGSAKCIKHNVNDLVSYARYLDANFSGWRWVNVYDKETGLQVGSFTCKTRPTHKFTPPFLHYSS